MNQLQQQTRQMLLEFLEKVPLKQGDILVVGCSSSEVAGGTIGQNSSMDTAQALVEVMMPVLKERGIYLAAQCCEHLNRAIIIDRQAVSPQQQVWVKPQPKAGGSFATAVWEALDQPVAVEHITATAGIDIGDTLIGMHLAHVAVPVRLENNQIGNARVVCAKTRPKYIGGPRAMYEDNIR